MPPIGIGFLASAPTAEDLVREATVEVFDGEYGGGAPALARLDTALDAYRAYRRECEARRGFGLRHIVDEDWRLTEAREAMFAAFDALEKGERWTAVCRGD